MGLHRQALQQFSLSRNSETPASPARRQEMTARKKGIPVRKRGFEGSLSLGAADLLWSSTSSPLSAPRLPTQLIIRQHKQSKNDGNTYLLKHISHQSHYPHISKTYEQIYNIPIWKQVLSVFQWLEHSYNPVQRRIR